MMSWDINSTMRSWDIDKIRIRFLQKEDCESLYILTKKYNRLDRVFSRVGADWMEKASFSEFLQNQPVLVVFYEYKYLGYLWLQAPKGCTAEAHFCTFPIVSSKFLLYAAKKVLKEMFGLVAKKYKEHFLESIYGFIASDNAKALAFVNKIGFKKKGVLTNAIKTKEGKLIDSILVTITRQEVEKWEKREE